MITLSNPRLCEGSGLQVDSLSQSLQLESRSSKKILNEPIQDSLNDKETKYKRKSIQSSSSGRSDGLRLINIGTQQSMQDNEEQSDYSREEVKNSKGTAFLEDFKVYVKNRQVVQRSRRDISMPQLDQIEEKTEINQGKSKVDTLIPQKAKVSTLRIMQDIQRKLKIQGKSKAEKFEESMNVFKGTETYIEIKPFLESMNVSNHKKYIEQINKYQQNIDIAKESSAHEEFVKNQLPAIHQSEIDFEIESSSIQIGGPVSGKNSLQNMKRFREILVKSQLKAGKSFNHRFSERMYDKVVQKLLNELNNEDKIGDQINRTEKQQSNYVQSSDSQRILLMPVDQLEVGLYPTAIDEIQASIAINVQRKEGTEKKAKVLGELLSDDEQFFANLKAYLSQAHRDIDMRNEIESEKNAYAFIIEDNLRKIEEAKLQHASKRLKGSVDPLLIFKEDRHIEVDKLYLRYRERAEQVRVTLSKVNQAVFSQKWANALMKRKVERQKEKAKLLGQFKNIKGPDTEDLLNPSKKMNVRILERRKMHDDTNAIVSATKSQQHIQEQQSHRIRKPASQCSSTPHNNVGILKNNTSFTYASPQNNIERPMLKIKSEKSLQSVQERLPLSSSFSLPRIVPLSSSSSSSMILFHKKPKNFSNIQSFDNKVVPQKMNKNYNSQDKLEPIQQSKQASEAKQSNNSEKNTSLTLLSPTALILSIQKKSKASENLLSFFQEEVQETEDQMKFSHLIEEIEEERQQYNQEAPVLKDQLRQIDVNFDKDMAKFETANSIQSIRSLHFNNQIAPTRSSRISSFNKHR